MRKIYFWSIFFLVFISSNLRAQNIWSQKTDCPITTSHGAIFCIGTKAYFCSGWNGITQNYNQQLWEYDAITDIWAQKQNPPWFSRAYSVAFSINNTGYFGTGSGSGLAYRDWWKYDPVTDHWTQLNSFPGNMLYGISTFTIGTKGYLCTGMDSLNNSQNQLWEFDPSSNTWSQKSNFPGISRAYAVGFGIGSKGYLGEGYESSTNFPYDFWQYDPAIDSWTVIADMGFHPRIEATGFSMNGKGYFGTGAWGINHADFWEYDPLSNLWQQKANFGGLGRDGAVGFSLNNHGYIGSGHYDSSYFNDFWEYSPNNQTTHELYKDNVATIFPNPISSFAIIKTTQTMTNASLIIYDTYGNKVKAIFNISGKQFSINREDLTNGIYYLHILQQNEICIPVKLTLTN
jgi:N-acetylneuraminic acid mutarotase